MALELLNDGATSFAAANWAQVDGTAGSGFADSATLLVPGGSASVTAGLDWSALTTGISYLKIADRFSGNIGTASVPLIVDADATATEWTSAASTSSRIEHYGTGTLYVKAGGGSSRVSNLFQAGTGRTVLTDGTATYLNVLAGTMQVGPAATASNVRLLGGSSTLGTKTAAGTQLDVVAGSHTIQRPFTTINVYGGVLNVNVYYAAAASSITIYGGTVKLISPGGTAITATKQFGGFLDWSSLRVDTTITTLTRYKTARISARPNGAALTVTNDTKKDPTIASV